jgi:hypothetical protein
VTSRHDRHLATLSFYFWQQRCLLRRRPFSPPFNSCNDLDICQSRLLLELRKATPADVNLRRLSRRFHARLTGRLRYAAPKREIMPSVEHRQHKRLNNRPENSHQPTRRRERIKKRFKSPRQVQRFLSTQDQIANIFSRCPSQDTAAKFHSARSQAFTVWAEVTGVAMAA